MLRFTAVLQPSGRGAGGHLVTVPWDVIAAMGGMGRIPVRATFNGVPYRGSIVRMGGSAVLGVTKAIMAEAGVSPGDELTVEVEVDEDPREVEVPEDLRRALDGDPAAAMAWERLSYTHRREHVQAIQEAKKPETRARRIERALEQLTRR